MTYMPDRPGKMLRLKDRLDEDLDEFVRVSEQPMNRAVGGALLALWNLPVDEQFKLMGEAATYPKGQPKLPPFDPGAYSDETLAARHAQRETPNSESEE